MRNRLLTSLIAAVAIAAATPSIAQTPARQQPDLQGVWRVWNLAKYDLEDHGAKPGVPAGRGFVVDPADGKIPYKPEALEKRRQIHEIGDAFHPELLPIGFSSSACEKRGPHLTSSFVVRQGISYKQQLVPF